MGQTNDAAAVMVVIRGALDDCWAGYLGDLVITSQVSQSQTASTILSGPLLDFAAFVGLIARLQNLGLSVQAISFHCLDSD